jgi:nicotinate phosphoribosyltransferase
VSGLLTDLYELTMAAGYFETGKATERATFELSVRRLPKNRNFVIAAGLPQAIDYLLNLRFDAEEIEYLRGLQHFHNASPAFFEYLRDFRFTGDVWAVCEGTPIFAGEPILTIRAPLIEAQIPETYLLSALTFQTLVATKAARMTEVAGGRDVIEFGTRRAHTPEAGVLGARAAYIGGCSATSNTLAGLRYNVPVAGTAAHSWVMSFASETESFRKMQELMGPKSVHLVDTYDAVEGTRKAISVGQPFWGIRIDSGDVFELSLKTRAMLDDAGFRDAKIMVSGDLDEYKIRDLVARSAPINAFGVGTELATSGDAPSMGAIYKMVEIGDRYTAKRSAGKTSWPGSKQIFRFQDHDLVACSSECVGEAEALQQPIVLGGQLIQALPDVREARRRAAESIAKLPAKTRELELNDEYHVDFSAQLIALAKRAR